MKKKIRPDKFTRTLAKGDGKKTTPTSLLSPSPNPATNLLIADILVRGAAGLFRGNVEKRVAKASYEHDEDAQNLIDGRTIVTSLALYGASKLATRSVPGLLVVTGSLLAKTLYDRGKARQRRLASDNTED